VIGDLQVWQAILLAVIYLADVVVFVGLCRGEFRDHARPHFPSKDAQALRRHLGRIAVLACFAVLPALASGCDPKLAAAPAAPPPQVGVVTVHPELVKRTTELPGRTSAVLTADVRPQVSGVILKRLFTEGDDVKEGQQLYQIDPATYQAAYDSAVATLAHDEAALADANARVARYKPLAAAQAVSKQTYDDALASASEAQADIASARAAIERARISLDYTRVLSPLTGRIGHSTVTPGALVTANQTSALATVTQLDPIHVDLNQPVAALLRFRQELASGEIERADHGAAKVTLKLEDGSTYPLPGKLEFTEVNVSQSTGTVLVRAIFPNSQHLLLPGMYVHAEIEEGVNRRGILVPQQAVSRNSHGDAVVLVIGDDNTAEARTLTTGPAVGDQWVITGGLKPGERVIVDGLQKVRPGMTVEPVAAGSSVASANLP
jgi:membrane fusion protein, multidrug efflux system